MKKEVQQAIMMMAIVISATACNKTTKTTKVNVPDVDQLKKDLDASTDASLEASRLAKEAGVKVYEDLMDQLSSGGQPGAIALQGPWVSDRVAVHSVTGTGWRKTQPTLEAKSINQSEFSNENFAALVALEDKNILINFGCDSTIVQKFGLGLNVLNLEWNNPPVRKINANTVLICDGTLLPKDLLSVTARTVVLDAATIQRQGGPVQSLTILSEELVLNGANQIISLGEEDEVTIVSGPSISLSALHGRGDGSLTIEAKGASYKPKIPTPTP